MTALVPSDTLQPEPNKAVANSLTGVSFDVLASSLETTGCQKCCYEMLVHGQLCVHEKYDVMDNGASSGKRLSLHALYFTCVEVWH